MKKTYSIGNDRSLTIAHNNEQLRIEEQGSNKWATFTPSRWASFLLCLDEIDHQLEKLSKGEDVAYRNHYGGGWHISVTSGFECVDLRKFYLPAVQTECKPTKTGIALRLTEWAMFKEWINVVQSDNLTVAGFLPCFLNRDHTTQLGIKACSECNPFPISVFK